MVKYAVGLMSGTSLDGVDAALVKIDDDYQMELIDFETIDIPEITLERIKRAMSIDLSNNQLLCSLNVELGYLFADAVKAVCKKANFSLPKLDYIASHGQTIYHMPNQARGSTLQLGEPSVIAYETGVQVISNFRAMDMAAGGEGAPLVPYFDYKYFSGNKNRGLLNIGGISNVTLLKANGTLDEVVAFDTGPGNMIINGLMVHFYNKPFDESGLIASQGQVDEVLLDQLMNDGYIKELPPKSTGREFYGQDYIQNLLKLDIAKEDLIATVTKLTAEAIVYNIKSNLTIDELIVSGGGVYNQMIMLYLNNAFIGKVFSSQDKHINPDAKEAMAFALLGYETLHNRPSNVPRATGARQHVILGSITTFKY